MLRGVAGRCRWGFIWTEEESGRRMEKLGYRSVQIEVSSAIQEYEVFTYQVEMTLAGAALSVSSMSVVAESRRAVDNNTSSWSSRPSSV